MEKLIVTIGLVGPLSTNYDHFEEKKYPEKDIKFIQECFEVSYRRAQKVINKLNEQKNCRSRYYTVILSYRQLARYTAKRQVEGLNQRWKYPQVIEHREEVPTQETISMELRPGKRDSHSC